MKFPRDIEVGGYGHVIVEPSGLFTVTLTIADPYSENELELVLYAAESKALRKALKAAEAGLVVPNHLRRDASV